MRFLRAGAFSREKRGIIVFCTVRTFASTVVFAQFPHSVERYRRFSIVLRYTNNHHHPYIDSTTVRSDGNACTPVVTVVQFGNVSCTRFHMHTQTQGQDNSHIIPPWLFLLPKLYSLFCHRDLSQKYSTFPSLHRYHQCIHSFLDT